MTADPATNTLRQAAHAWCLKTQSGALSGSEETRFQAWLAADPSHMAAYDRAVTLTQAFQSLSPADFDVDVVKPSLRERFLRFIQSVAVIGRRPSVCAAVLACGVAIAVALHPGLKATWSSKEYATGSARYASAIGQTKALTLMDGTRATLAPATQLTIRYTDTVRRVELISGAALFDVAKQPERPFAVAAGHLTARALGTVFEARNNGGVARIAVAEGRVRVAFDAQISGTATAIPVSETLGTGQQISATDLSGLGIPQDIAPSAVAAWRAGRLDYDEATLSELVSDANRYAQQRIYLAPNQPDLAALKVTASFDAYNTSAMLDALVALFPVRIIQDGKSGLRIEDAGPAQ
ncbi:MAG: FecR domain-containing protein [Pseudomonadota bacterium]